MVKATVAGYAFKCPRKVYDSIVDIAMKESPKYILNDDSGIAFVADHGQNSVIKLRYSSEG
jgi:hypothetical protein